MFVVYVIQTQELNSVKITLASMREGNSEENDPLECVYIRFNDYHKRLEAGKAEKKQMPFEF